MHSIRSWALIGTVVLLALGEPPPIYARRAATPTPGAAVQQPNGGTPAPDLRAAIERAAGFLGTRDQSGRSGWATTQGALLLGSKFQTWARTLKLAPVLAKTTKPGAHPNFSELLETRLWSLRSLPERPMVKLSTPAPALVDRDAARHFEEQDLRNLLEVLLVAVSCRSLTPEQRAQWPEQFATPGRSYLLAYQLIGLMIGYNQGCLTAKVAEPIRARLATQLFAQATTDSDTLDGLAIERFAALCYAGVCDWIDSKLIARLVSEQQPSGSWGTRNPHVSRSVNSTEDQIAALAFYVLARSWSLHHPTGAAPSPPTAPHPLPPARR